MGPISIHRLLKYHIQDSCNRSVLIVCNFLGAPSHYWHQFLKSYLGRFSVPSHCAVSSGILLDVEAQLIPAYRLGKNAAQMRSLKKLAPSLSIIVGFDVLDLVSTIICTTWRVLDLENHFAPGLSDQPIIPIGGRDMPSLVDTAI